MNIDADGRYEIGDGTAARDTALPAAVRAGTRAERMVTGTGLAAAGQGAGTNNYWVKFAHGEITPEYQEYSLIAAVSARSGTNALTYAGIVHIRVQQQAAFGNQPNTTVTWLSRHGYDQADCAVFVTSTAGPTTFDVWVRSPASYVVPHFLPIWTTETYDWEWFDGYTLQSGTPSGTETDGVDADGVIPYGSIMLWYGQTTTIPNGWALCDGTNGTPDLRDRFIVGASTSNEGTSGGTISATSALTAHGNHTDHATHSSHGFNQPSAHGVGTATGGGVAAGSGISTAALNSHSHGLTNNHSGGSVTGSHSAHATHGAHSAHPIQNYYRLAYIMKV